MGVEGWRWDLHRCSLFWNMSICGTANLAPEAVGVAVGLDLEEGGVAGPATRREGADRAALREPGWLGAGRGQHGSPEARPRTLELAREGKGQGQSWGQSLLQHSPGALKEQKRDPGGSTESWEATGPSLGRALV